MKLNPYQRFLQAQKAKAEKVEVTMPEVYVETVMTDPVIIGEAENGQTVTITSSIDTEEVDEKPKRKKRYRKTEE